MKICLYKRGDSLLIDEDDRPYMAAFRDGDVIYVDVYKNRNYRNLKRYFKFINMAFDMQEIYHGKENFRKVIQSLAGWYDEIILPNGQSVREPRSISFEEMDEVEFRKLFSEAVNAFIANFGGGLTEREWEKIILF